MRERTRDERELGASPGSQQARGRRLRAFERAGRTNNPEYIRLKVNALLADDSVTEAEKDILRRVDTVGDATILPMLRGFLKVGDFNERANTVRVLGRLGSVAVPHLVEALGDQEWGTWDLFALYILVEPFDTTVSTYPMLRSAL